MLLYAADLEAAGKKERVVVDKTHAEKANLIFDSPWECNRIAGMGDYPSKRHLVHLKAMTHGRMGE